MHHPIQISKLQPSHIGSPQWIGGVFSFLEKTSSSLDVLITDPCSLTPFLFSFPNIEELSSFPFTSKETYYFFAVGSIEAAFSIEDIHLFTATAREFALFSSKGELLLSKGPHSTPTLSQTFLQGFFPPRSLKSNPTFLSVQEVLSLANYGNIQFSLKEIQVLCYKLWAMKEFTAIIHTSSLGSPKKETPANFSSDIYREDIPSPSFLAEDILSHSSHKKEGYFLIPSILKKEGTSNEPAL